jgi:methylated-DNA-[protein]-cysteine S-methyltransferase
MQCWYRTWSSPLGTIHLIADDRALLVLAWDDNIEVWNSRLKPEILSGSHPILDQILGELEAYFQGRLDRFKTPWDFPGGTPFQRKVWKELHRIPYGHTCSYASIAEALAHPKATRAVGAANGQNPLSLILPCHRVIGKNGKLTGYAGGLQQKKALLDLERLSLSEEMS